MSAALGFLESASIARGVLATDAAVKQAPVDVLLARRVEPGKFLLLVAGSVEDVQASCERGAAVLGEALVDRFELYRPHRQLFEAFFGHPRLTEGEALGLIETSSVAAAIEAADGAAKRAEVQLLRLQLALDMGGKGVVVVGSPEVSDVEEAVARGADIARARQALVQAVVIPRPAPGLMAFLDR